MPYSTRKADRQTKNGSPNVPTLEQIRNIKHFEFRLDGNSPELKAAVQQSLQKLKQKYPDYSFSATFGGLQ